MAKVLIVYYSLGGNTKIAAKAVERGAKTVSGAEVTMKNALEANADDLIECDAVAIGTPDYFSYIAGGLKDFFDRTYYQAKDKVNDKPCVIFMTHGGGGKAIDSIKTICDKFKFKQINEPILVKGKPDSKAEKQLEEAGKKLATT
jgi:flavorubredoxin